MLPATTATASTGAPSRVVRAMPDGRSRRVALLTLACVLIAAAAGEAHGVTGKDALFLQGVKGAAIGPLMYLGAKHMVTGYDHLAFLIGVVFFLYRTRDVVLYASLFTLGHSLTLLGGVLGGIHANSSIVDAIIGLSVVYKALDNMDAFPRFLGFQPDTRAAVLAFRPLPRIRTRHEASGVLAVARRPCGQHHQLQCRCRDWAVRRAYDRAGGADGLARPARLPRTCVCHERGADDVRTPAVRVPAVRLHPGGVMAIGQPGGAGATGAGLSEEAGEVVHARERIALAVGIALLVSGIMLVIGVLPAEFGVDPTGVGRRLGLLALSDVKSQLTAFEQARDDRESAQTVALQERPFQQETVKFALAPGEFVEYRYRLDKGESLLYSWQATAGVNVEFHAEPDGAPKGYAETYEKQGAVERASGTLIAPFAGIHGWFWENATNQPVTVSLTAAGFYNVSHEFHKDAAPKTRMFQ